LNENVKREHPNWLVTDEALLEKLVDDGYLLSLCRVAKSNRDETKRVWFFDKDDGVKEIIDAFYDERRKHRRE
jgi:hypothetical protein